MARWRFCDSEDFLKCTKEHYGLELKIVFNNKKTRETIFDILKTILEVNLDDKIVDRLDFSKTDGEVQNGYTETIGIHSISVWANGNKDGFTKPLLEGVAP